MAKAYSVNSCSGDAPSSSEIKEDFISDYINIIKDEYFSKFATELNHIIAYPDSGIEVKII